MPVSSACSAVVPYRADDAGERAANLKVVTEWLAAMSVPTIVVEHGPHPTLEVDQGSPFQHAFIRSSGPFSKAASCNLGFAMTGAPVVAFVDADTLVHDDALRHCIDRCAQPESGVDVLRPFGRLIELDAEQTRAVRHGGPLPDYPWAPPDSARGTEHIPLCGGVVVMRSAAFVVAGGMDEAFLGWGGEDDALSAALRRSGATCRVLANEPAFHLHHEPAPRRHPHYEAGLERLRWWQQAPDDEVARARSLGRQHLLALRRDAPQS